MPITVWNPPTKSVRPLSSKAEELKRKDLVLGTNFTLDVASGYSFEGFGQKSQTKRGPC